MVFQKERGGTVATSPRMLIQAVLHGVDNHFLFSNAMDSHNMVIFLIFRFDISW
jgi:hypothetical protein